MANNACQEESDYSSLKNGKVITCILIREWGNMKCYVSDESMSS